MASKRRKDFGLYKIQSIKYPERFYIGSTSQVVDRLKMHKRELIKGNHHSHKMQYHVNKYGIEDLEFIILERFVLIDKDDLLAKEQYLLDTLHPYFNECLDARSVLGITRSAKFCEEQRQRAQSPDHPFHNKEYEDKRNRERWRNGKLVGDKNPFFGKKNSQETIDKIIAANTGRIKSEEEIRGISERFKKMWAEMSQEDMQIRRDRMTGNKYREGIKDSDETREKKSKALKEYWAKKKNGNNNIDTYSI